MSRFFDVRKGFPRAVMRGSMKMGCPIPRGVDRKHMDPLYRPCPHIFTNEKIKNNKALKIPQKSCKK